MMKRMILTYGIVAGVVILASMVAANSLVGDTNLSIWLGYLIMLVGLSAIFVAVKRYRDQELGGVIKFGAAFLLGLAISVIAGIAYVASWEIHLAATDYAFIDDYAQSVIDEAKSDGADDAEIARIEADMEEMTANYAKVFYRMPMTFLEIFPVGLLISLIAAAVLRNPKVPAESS